MKSIYEDLIIDMASTDRGKEELFLLYSCVANQARDAETEEERVEQQKIARYLMWSACLASRKQARFFRSLIKILKPVAKDKKGDTSHVVG